MKISLGAKTLLFPTPVLMVGTYDQAGKPNLMNAAWGGICCSQPPCISVSLRKATYSYAAIVERKAFTVGVASEARMKEADFVGLISGRDVDKFAAAGLTPVKSDLVADDGFLDIQKIKPLVFDTSHRGYHGIGPLLGKAFSVGKVFIE